MTAGQSEAAAPAPSGETLQPSREPRKPRRRRTTRTSIWWLAAAVLLALGFRLALLAEHPLEWYSTAAKVVLFLPLLALVPPVARVISEQVGRVRRVARERRKWVALGIAAVGMSYLYASGAWQGIRLVPMVKDEYSYLLQARMIAAGKLWLPSHPISDFFETTAVITDRVYASCYPPGTAILFAPGVALGLPHWVTAMLISGAALALLYLVVAALADDWLGIAACLLLIVCEHFRGLWYTAMAQIPLMLAGLLMVGCFLQWRAKRYRTGWAFATGAAAGMAMIIRPQDGACYVLPVAVAFLLELRRGRRREVAKSIGLCTAAAVPFLVLQLVTNYGITGRVTDFPHQYYHRRDLPNLGYGFSPDLYNPARPQSVSPQKQSEFDVERSGLRKLRGRSAGWIFWNKRLPILLGGTLPEPFLATLLPVGLLLVARRSRWVLAATVPLFVLVYLPWPHLLPHYPLVVAPGALALVVLGALALERRARRFRPLVTALFALAVVAVVVASLPEVNRAKEVEGYPVVTPQDIDELVGRVTAARAVVLLRFDPKEGYKMRPYNLDVAWPDDAPIVKALDLGERNIEIIAYYGELQPDREFFLFDFKDNSLRSLGRAVRSDAPPQPGG